VRGTGAERERERERDREGVECVCLVDGMGWRSLSRIKGETGSNGGEGKRTGEEEGFVERGAQGVWLLREFRFAMRVKPGWLMEQRLVARRLRESSGGK
jgi:hypothetical protein